MLERLIIYWNNEQYWVTTDIKEVPHMFAYNWIDLTPKKVAEILENPSLVKKEFPHLLKWVRERFRNNLVMILDYNLPDVNGNECDVSD
jgi:hypothetical protein